uniref:Interleukin 12 receptor subunit beta 2 n=1 Tax=Lepisosteus oculatus TaxID=7918 RepID=W5MJL6_LEPOC
RSLMPVIWSWFTLNLIFLLYSRGASDLNKLCAIFATNGTLGKLGSSIEVYCTFKKFVTGRCRKAIFRDTNQEYNFIEYNSTTLLLKTELRKHRTVFVCKCAPDEPLYEPCGLDILAGLSPDVPQNLICIQNGNYGDITCRWKKGSNTHIETTYELWVKTESYNGTKHLASHSGSEYVIFPVLHSEVKYSVWVTASNKLGTASSPSLKFTLNDIVKFHPPHVTVVNCSSQNCTLHWRDIEKAQLLEVRYQIVGESSWIYQTFKATANNTLSCGGLQPFTTYTFQARCKLSCTEGIWSEWNDAVNTTTGEADPLQKLDVWHIVESSESKNKFVSVVWKKLTRYEARGVVLGYEVLVEDQVEKKLSEVYITNSSYSKPVFCSHCTVTVSALNSKGSSPPATISIPILSDLSSFPSPRNVTCLPHSNHSIMISWEPPLDSPVPLHSYIVEWSQAYKDTKLSLTWKRLSHHQLSTVISENVQPCVCYKGAVYALYDQGLGKAGFVNAYSWQSVPSQGPKLNVRQWDNKSLTVYWKEVSEQDKRGCLKSYNLYLENIQGHLQKYGPIDPTHRSYTISDLQPAASYYLWMTASTDTGEGRKGEKYTFTTYPEREDDQLLVIWPTTVLVSFLVWLFLVFLCRVSVQRRPSPCCFCIIPGNVPDPANSKWAKEYAAVKGHMKLVYELYNNSTSSNEEPNTIEIEEIPEDSLNVSRTVSERNILPSGEPKEQQSQERDSGQTSCPPCQSQGLGTYKGQFTCPYIKSLSQESEFSTKTQISCSTDTTGDYIPSNVLLSGTSEEDSNDFMEDELMEFSSCHNSPFLEPMITFGGKLTLDAVKIDCSSFMD